VAVASIDLWRAIPDSLWQQEHGADAARARGHGGDPITSVTAHLRPEMLRPDLARPAGRGSALGLPMSGPSGVVFEGQAVHLPLDADEVNPDGMMGGDPALASPAIGAAIFEHVAGHCARFAAHFRGCDPRNPVQGGG
jgi:creatinine amidohydrolase